MSHINKGDVHAYLDGALGAYPEEAARDIRAHLDACRECAQLLEGERRSREEASAILAASASGPVELAPLEELRARAAEWNGQERAEGAEGSELTGRARRSLGRARRTSDRCGSFPAPRGDRSWFVPGALRKSYRIRANQWASQFDSSARSIRAR